MSKHDAPPYFVPSDKLRELKQLLSDNPLFKQELAEIAEFRLVLDTSVILADIIWLARHGDAATVRTGLLEVIEAGTVVIYGPPKLEEEVEEHLPRISRECGISTEVLRLQWTKYKSHLRVLKPLTEAQNSNWLAIDPNDVEFLAVADKIAAHGILSRDSDIRRMGGTQLGLDFVLCVRDYSRAAAIDVQLRCGGISLAIVAVGVVYAIIAGIRALLEGFARLPSPIKVVLIVAAIILVVHPGSRTCLAHFFREIGNRISEATGHLATHVAEASSVAYEQKELAAGHLERAVAIVTAASPRKTVSPVRIRRRRRKRPIGQINRGEVAAR